MNKFTVYHDKGESEVLASHWMLDHGDLIFREVRRSKSRLRPHYVVDVVAFARGTWKSVKDSAE